MNERGVYQDCEASTYCQMDRNLTKIDWNSLESLHNWVEHLDIACDSHTQFGMIGSAYFSGYTLSCLFVPRLADLYGRRLPFLVSSWFQLFIFIGIFFSNSYLFTVALILVFGFCGAGRSVVGYLYLLELVPSDWKTLVGTSLHSCNSLTFIMSALYFWFISKDWRWIILFSMIFNFIAVLGVTFIVPESPIYLY